MVRCPVNHRSVRNGGRAPWKKRRAFIVVCLCSNKWELSRFYTTEHFFFLKKKKRKKKWGFLRSVIRQLLYQSLPCVLLRESPVAVKWWISSGIWFSLWRAAIRFRSKCRDGQDLLCFLKRKQHTEVLISSALLSWWASRREKGKVSGTTFTMKLGRDRMASYFTQSNS